jgi:hypothetical protein
MRVCLQRAAAAMEVVVVVVMVVSRDETDPEPYRIGYIIRGKGWQIYLRQCPPLIHPLVSTPVICTYTSDMYLPVPVVFGSENELPTR